MIKKLIIYEKYEIYFNYGIFSNHDYILVRSVINECNYISSNNYPTKNEFDLFFDTMENYEKNRKLSKSRSKKDKTSEPLIFVFNCFSLVIKYLFNF